MIAQIVVGQAQVKENEGMIWTILQVELELLEGAGPGQGLPAQQMIVGDVGELGEDGEAADQQQHVRQRQAFERRVQTSVPLTAPMLAHGAGADVLDLVEGRPS